MRGSWPRWRRLRRYAIGLDEVPTPNERSGRSFIEAVAGSTIAAMNLLADLVAVEERIDEMRALLRRQEAIILRLHRLDALPAVTRTAEMLYGIVANSIEAARAHRDALAAALEKYPSDGVISTMQIGLLAHHWGSGRPYRHALSFTPNGRGRGARNQ